MQKCLTDTQTRIPVVVACPSVALPPWPGDQVPALFHVQDGAACAVRQP